MSEILDAPLLEKRDEFGVVEVALRVEVTVADFDGMVEAEVGHAANYTMGRGRERIYAENSF